MDEFPADAAAVGLVRAIAGDARWPMRSNRRVRCRCAATRGLVALITANRLGRLQVLQPDRPARGPRLYRRRRHARLPGDVLAMLAQRRNLVRHRCCGSPRTGLGRDERSAMPARRRPGSARATAPSLSPLHHMSAPLRLWKDRLPQLRGPSRHAVVEGGLSKAEAAQTYGVTAKGMARWPERFRADDAPAWPTVRHGPKPVRGEPQQRWRTRLRRCASMASTSPGRRACRRRR